MPRQTEVTPLLRRSARIPNDALQGQGGLEIRDEGYRCGVIPAALVLGCGLGMALLASYSSTSSIIHATRRQPHQQAGTADGVMKLDTLSGHDRNANEPGLLRTAEVQEWEGGVNSHNVHDFEADYTAEVADDPASGDVERHAEGWRTMRRAEHDVSGTAREGEEARASSKGSSTKPNVFFFMVDDMGFGDIGYQSTDLAKLTPNLDAMAAGGVKLSNYYSMSLCTPARASLMTGRYPVRLGMQYYVIVAGSPWGLPLSEKVLPEYMNDAGYESHMVGKWHLGGYNQASLPHRRGFKTYMGYTNGESTYYTHKNLEAFVDGEAFYDFGFGNETDYYDITKESHGIACSGPSFTDGTRGEEEYLQALSTTQSPGDLCYTGTYATDAYLGRAEQIVNQKTPWDEEPLFLYMAHQAVHAPNGPAPAEGFNEVDQALLHEVYLNTDSAQRRKFAGVLLYLDKRLGEFMDMLEAKGWLDNSIVVVASDNGGCPSKGGTSYPLRGSKETYFEGGTKVPAFVWSKSHLPEELRGTTYDELMHVTDWLPTLASAAGGSTDGSAGPLDGVDHWNSLASVKSKGDGDGAQPPRTEMLYNWDPYTLNSNDGIVENFNRTQGAFRQGNWKLLVNSWCSGYYSHDKRITASDPYLAEHGVCNATLTCEACNDKCAADSEFGYEDMLFNLETDPRERNNLIDEFPEIADRLRQRADEVVLSEWTPTNFVPVDKRSYGVWLANERWMVPWEEKLAVETSA